MFGVAIIGRVEGRLLQAEDAERRCGLICFAAAAAAAAAAVAACIRRQRKTKDAAGFRVEFWSFAPTFESVWFEYGSVKPL